MVVLVVEEQNVITIDIEEPEDIQLVINPEKKLLSSLDDVSITSPINNDFLVHNGSNWINEIAATARTSMGLGTISTQNANNVDIDGGNIDGTAIGTNTASTSKFTTINAIGTVTINDNIISKPELKDYSETNTSPSSSSGTLTLDLENGNVFEVTLTENVTTTIFNNPPATGKGGSFTIILKQDGSGGHTFVWPASVDWAGASAPTLTTTPNAVDILAFITTDAGTRWYGFLGGADFG